MRINSTKRAPMWRGVAIAALTILPCGVSIADKTPQAPAATSSAPAPSEAKPIVVPLDVRIPNAPRAFAARGKTHLVYEIHAVNMASRDCQITKLEVLAGSSAQRALSSLSGDALEKSIGAPADQGKNPATIAARTETVIYMWVTFDRAEDVPATLKHRFTTKVGAYPEELVVTTLPLAVDKDAPIRIQSPLRGDNWGAVNGPSNVSLHRRTLIPVDAHATASQRFAIDWVKLGVAGTTYHGDKLDNKNYYAYGVEVHSVADGVVTEVKDGIPENVPTEDSRAVPITLETVGGNHVIVDIGGGHFAFYAHLQPSSLRVKLGERVRAGQVIGLLGNSGNSTEPHLHFHISDSNSPLGTEGLPYALDSFEVQGSGWGWKPSANDVATPYTNEIPLENDIVRFE
jgi:murein DD-endopeptidase